MTKDSFKLTNTLSRSLEELRPLHAPEVLVYTCGPTVYNFPHIGNIRTFIFEDVLVKSLRRFGYAPKRVMNITDVGHLTDDADEGEDKMEVGARREGVTAWDIAKKYEEAFLDDLAAFQLETPEIMVRATDTIQEQIQFIQELESRGFTYRTSDGVYFDSSKVPDYGKLARLDVAGLQEGIRVAVGEKRNKTDFALWKFSGEAGKRHMEWQSPWGVGFPGWHIECSAIIRSTLGDEIDIHCGGADHIFVHHPNEMAQSESVTGKPLARMWLHSEFLLIDGGKMSKSLGNVYTRADLEERGIDPLAFRLFTYSANYRARLNFTWEGVNSAAAQLRRLRQHYQAVAEGEWTEVLNSYQERLNAALADDMNMSVVLAVVWEVLNADLTPREKRAFLEDAGTILSLDLGKQENQGIPEEVSRLLEEREKARADQDWDRSDALRNQMADLGYHVKDTASGQEVLKI
ncbi:MAG TPA: cysteine--tRNA ligase [Verrucomicrobiae bacterium]|nr:cysteine--tRNA ligase [Verrucomicrobiae bacterium]